MPKKGLSPALQQVSGRRRDDPRFVGSSVTLPRATNGAFNNALEALRSVGYNVDRSDVITTLLDRFCCLVQLAEQQQAGQENPDLDLEAIAAAAVADPVLHDLGQVSHLKKLLHQIIVEAEAAAQRQWAQQEALLAQLAPPSGKSIDLGQAAAGWVFHSDGDVTTRSEGGAIVHEIGPGGQWMWHGPGPAPPEGPPQRGAAQQAPGSTARSRESRPA